VGYNGNIPDIFHSKFKLGCKGTEKSLILRFALIFSGFSTCIFLSDRLFDQGKWL
jgi:hypothetical protein